MANTRTVIYRQVAALGGSVTCGASLNHGHPDQPGGVTGGDKAGAWPALLQVRTAAARCCRFCTVVRLERWWRACQPPQPAGRQSVSGAVRPLQRSATFPVYAYYKIQHDNAFVQSSTSGVPPLQHPLSRHWAAMHQRCYTSDAIPWSALQPWRCVFKNMH